MERSPSHRRSLNADEVAAGGKSGDTRFEEVQDMRDVVVVVRVGGHRFFRRKGDNVYCDMPISFLQAALGCTLQIPTIYGHAHVRSSHHNGMICMY